MLMPSSNQVVFLNSGLVLDNLLSETFNFIDNSYLNVWRNKKKNEISVLTFILIERSNILYYSCNKKSQGIF